MSFQQGALALSAMFAAGLALGGEASPILLGGIGGSTEGPSVLVGTADIAPMEGTPGLGAVSCVIALVLAYRGGLMPWQWALALSVALVVWSLTRGLRWPQATDKVFILTLGLTAALLPTLSHSIDPGQSLFCWALLLAACLWWNALRCSPSFGFIPLQGGWILCAACFSACTVANGYWLAAHDPELLGRIWGMVIPIHAVHPFFPNQNLMAGGLMVPACLFCVSGIAQGKRTLAAGLFLVWLLLFLSYCGYRGASLGFAAGLCWLALRQMRGARGAAATRALVVIGTAGLLFVLILNFLPQTTISQRLSAQQTPATADPYSGFRLRIWKESLALAGSRPLSGWGLGSYGDAIETRDIPTPPRQPYLLQRYRLHAGHAHNEWLELAAECGFPALLVALAALALLLWGLFNAKVDSGERPALEAVVICFLTQSCVDFNLHCPFIAVALALVLARLFPAGHSMALGRPARLAGAAVLALLLPMALQSWRASAMPAPDPAQLAALDPFDAEATMTEAEACMDGPQGEYGKAMRLAARSLAMAPDSAKVNFRAAILFHAIRRRASEYGLQGMGQYFTGWEDTKVEAPQASSSQRFEMLSHQAILKAEQYRPHDARICLSAATMSLESGDIVGAQLELDKALAIEPNFAGAWEMRARLEEGSHDKVGLTQSLRHLKDISQIPVDETDPMSAAMKQADWPWILAKMASLGVQ
jgi:O-antigen ligase